MHTDSRNPVVYTSGLKATDYYGHSFAFDIVYGYDVPSRGLQNINPVMYIDEFDMEAYDMQYIKRSDYDALKAKLENLERKHAKLKRRHDNVGAKYLVVKQEKDYLISCQSVYTKEDFLP